MQTQLQPTSSATAEIHPRSLKVIRCCANRRGIYNFLLALNSNITSISNRSWDIMPSFHIHTPLSSRWNWKRRLAVGGHALVLGCPVHWDIQPLTSICAHVHRMITMHARPRQTDRRTDRRTSWQVSSVWHATIIVAINFPTFTIGIYTSF